MCFLKELRLAKGMTQNDVSKFAGISQPTYCNIENSERRPSVKMAKKIGAVLGFDWTKFYEENNVSDQQDSA